MEHEKFPRKRKAPTDAPTGRSPKRANLFNLLSQPSTSNEALFGPRECRVPPPATTSNGALSMPAFVPHQSFVGPPVEKLVPATEVAIHPSDIMPPGPSASETSKSMKYNCLNPYYCIIIIPNGHPHLFFGFCRVLCYSGAIRIDGYDLENSGFDGEPESMYAVCAPACEGRPALFESRTLEPQKAWVKEKRLLLRLKEVTPEYERIVDEWRKENVSILLLYKKLPIMVSLFTYIYEKHLYFSQHDMYADRIDLIETYGWNMYREENWRNLERGLNHLQQRSEQGLKSIVLPYGCKGAGKSTFVRILINRLLSKKFTVYMLDADLGQPEYTPAGCMSLWKVTKPLLDVPWCHQATTYQHSYFYSDVSPANDMEKYKNIFELLLNTFKEKSEETAILVINTMGWIEGAGLAVLEHINNLSKPSLLFGLAGKDRLPLIWGSAESKCYGISRDYPLTGNSIFKHYRPRILKPCEYRELRVIGYFSHVMTQPFFANLVQGRKYKINFNEAKFGIPEDLASVDDHYFLASLNVQLVALCSSEAPITSRRILEREYLPEMFTIDPSTPNLRCYGFGIISAVDLKSKQFSIISPISPEEMQKVTIMARGRNMKVPPSLCQASNGRPAMYQMSSQDSVGSVNPDLYSELRTERQKRFHRQYFPVES